jgi:hypothetical protein
MEMQCCVECVLEAMADTRCLLLVYRVACGS